MRVAAILPTIFLCSLSFSLGQTPGTARKLPADLNLVTPYAQSLQEKDAAKTQPLQTAALVPRTVQEPACAHIQIYSASPDVDPQIALPAAAGLAAAMPTMKALPACAAPKPRK